MTFQLVTFWEITLYIAFVSLATWAISILIRTFLARYLKRKQSRLDRRTSLNFLKNSIRFFSVLIAISIIVVTVPALRSKAVYFFSGAGILAAIVGFAAQAAISNLIAGAFIVIFKPFRVGDYIKVEGEQLGVVEDITLRHIIINNLENKRLVIPNAAISTQMVLNHTIKDPYVLSISGFRIGLHADIDLAKKIIREEALKIEYVLEDNITSSHFLKSDNGLEIVLYDVHTTHIELRAWIWIEQPYHEIIIKSKLREAVHKRFIKEGVQLAIPVSKFITVENPEDIK